jgi:hypothetical protein
MAFLKVDKLPQRNRMARWRMVDIYALPPLRQKIGAKTGLGAVVSGPSGAFQA